MFRQRLLLLVVVLTIVGSRTSLGQLGGGVGGGGGGIGGGGGFGGGGMGAGGNGGNPQNSSGIKIDPQGVLSLIVPDAGTGTHDKKRRSMLANKYLSHDLNQRTKLRCVSLVELERRLEEILSRHEPIPNDLFYLAGLQRIDEVQVFLDEQDLVIAGPAEGFAPDAVGRMIGVESGRPTLRLDDLFVAIRTVGKSRQLGCSIDPIPERLAELRRFMLQAEPASIEEVEGRFNQMDDILGLQDVRIDGVPPDSHFATLLVEADYRMKLIAVGLENLQIKGIKSHLALMGGRGGMLQRWWFVPSYSSITRSDDGLAFQFVGQRAQLLTEEEFVDASGNRTSSPVTKKSVQAFAKLFTEKFPQLADKSPVFGELQNLIDWAVFAALLSHERIPERIGWKQELLCDETRLPHPVFETPKKVPSQVSYKRAGNMIVGLVSGGVVIHPQQACEKALADGQNSTARRRIHSIATPSNQTDVARWWWDGN